MYVPYRNLHYWLVVLLTLNLSTSCTQKLTAPEAEKHLKAFDSEMIMLAKQVSTSTTYSALSKLFSINNVPLPFKYTPETGSESLQSYDFEYLKGEYRYDGLSGQFYKHAGSDSVIIIFPFTTPHDSLARFVVAKYSEEQSIWGSMLPIGTEMFLEIAGYRPLAINAYGKITNGIPIEYSIRFKLENLTADFSLKTKLRKNGSRLSTQLEINRNDDRVLTASTTSVIKVSPDNALLFEKLIFNGKVFPIEVKGKVDYGKINPSKKFIEEFNRNTSIIVQTDKNQRLGVVELTEHQLNDRLNFVVRYKNGELCYLNDLLFSIRTVMNIKL